MVESGRLSPATSNLPKPAPYVPYVPPVLTPSSTTAPNPNNSMQDDFQQEMLYYFELEGYWGLSRTIYERAKKEVGKSTKYKLLEYTGQRL